MDVDPVWEYNAVQFVDFAKPMDDDGVDKYFGTFIRLVLVPANFCSAILRFTLSIGTYSSQ